MEASPKIISMGMRIIVERNNNGLQIISISSTSQLKAPENLEGHGISYRPALMTFSRDIGGLMKRQGRISPGLSEDLDIESLMLFPHVKKELEKRKIY